MLRDLHEHQRRRPRRGDQADHGFEGLYFKFPFQTEQTTYQFWDGSLGEAPDIEFKEVETIEGLDVYRFEQVDPAHDGRHDQRAASIFGIDEEGDVALDRVYSNTRTLWIEPETGVIIRGQEDQLTVAEYEGEQVATLTDVTIGYNPDTVSDNVQTYSALSTQLKIIRVWVPLVGGILGLLLLLAGWSCSVPCDVFEANDAASSLLTACLRACGRPVGPALGLMSWGFPAGTPSPPGRGAAIVPRVGVVGVIVQ